MRKIMKRRTINFVITTALFGLSFSANAAFPTYHFTDLGTLGGGSSTAYAINNVGQIVGEAASDGNFTSATIWNETTATALYSKDDWSRATAINDVGQITGFSGFNATSWNGTSTTNLLGGYRSQAFGINDSGQIVGSSVISYSDTNYYATVWNGRTSTYLANYAAASDINNAGQVVGFSSATGGFQHATLWSDNINTDLGTLGGNFSIANAINDSGQIVGYSHIAGNSAYHATSWNGTLITDLGKLEGATSSLANAINSSGQTVGSSLIYGATLVSQRATLWTNNSIFDLNSFMDARAVAAGWILLQANGINDSGWIVGNASNSLLGINSHAFLLTPVPEPETYSMFLIGFGLVGFVASRSRKNQ